MKEVKINKTSKYGKTHSVYLGNGTINDFTSLREANQFLAETNKFLNFKIHTLHKIYREVWSAYQANWFYFDNGRKIKKANLYSKERECTQLLTSIQNHFDLTVQRSGFTNGNYFAFTHLLSAAENLDSVVRLLADLYGMREDFNAIYDMDSTIMNIMYMQNEMNNYGKTSRTKLFKVPTHISEKKNFVPELPEFTELPELRVA